MEDWRKNKRAFAIFIGPATLWLLVFFTIPVIVIWVYSFGERGPQGQTYLVFNLENYVRAIEPIHLGIMWKSIWIGAISTAPDDHGSGRHATPRRRCGGCIGLSCTAIAPFCPIAVS